MGLEKQETNFKAYNKKQHKRKLRQKQKTKAEQKSPRTRLSTITRTKQQEKREKDRHLRRCDLKVVSHVWRQQANKGTQCLPFNKGKGEGGGHVVC